MSATYTKAHMVLHRQSMSEEWCPIPVGKKLGGTHTYTTTSAEKSFMIKFLIYVIESLKYGIANKYG